MPPISPRCLSCVLRNPVIGVEASGLERESSDFVRIDGGGCGEGEWDQTRTLRRCVSNRWISRGWPTPPMSGSLDLLLHSVVAGTIVSDGRVCALVVATKRGLQAITGSVFIDCTGDGGALIPTLRPGEFIGAMTRVRSRDGAPIDITDPRQATWGELEGRRLAAEVAAGTEQPDVIARGAWPREYHVRDRSTEYEFLAPGVTYDIPFGALRTNEVPNLLVAGRCISADHDALASTRVMAPSMAIGEAAGTAAALAARDAITPNMVDVSELQATLRTGGARI